ncbi:hypothetical protein DZF97_03020 [Clavibacter nebraskensis]|uniref:Uncharacterized protein n=1 Tax=Clavibacter nebraskensis TaxID=31963 RepID=A0A399QEG1_9MICO|nr:hypothetical protein DZF97_03020 [Clavibacter nebraskensis]
MRHPTRRDRIRVHQLEHVPVGRSVTGRSVTGRSTEIMGLVSPSRRRAVGVAGASRLPAPLPAVEGGSIRQRIRRF